MSLPSITLPAGTAEAPAGRYVAAELAEQLESTLSKLVWQVLYGKAIDASTHAMAAEQLLGTIGRSTATA